MMSRTLPTLDNVLEMPDDACAALRDVCTQAGYSESTLDLTRTVPRGVQGMAIPLLRRALLHATSETPDHTFAAGVLALLFACEDDVGEAAVREILGGSLTDALLSSGFIAPSTVEGSLSSNFQFLPLGGLYLVGDHVANGASAVMPPGPTTGELLGVMPAHIVGSVLDIGCGPGSLALAAARRGARWATGVDINPRAIQMAKFNAHLNGVSNVTFAAGDLTEPVRGERFDLVVAQPPFVVQPEDTVAIVFVHGGPTGETITQRVVAALADVLAPGGRALILAETPTRPSEPAHQHFRRDADSAAIDLVVLATPASSPDQQALMYATLEAPEGGPDYTAAVARYADHLESLDIRLVSHVLIVARARDPESAAARHRFSATIPVKRLSVGDGYAIDALLTSLDLASADEGTLAEAKLRASPFAQWVEERTAPDPAQQPTRAVRFAQGRFASDIDNLSESAFRLAGLVDAAESVETAAREHARLNGLDVDAARAQMLRFVREALGRGLLEPYHG
jgi:SAM-dependent methyltransferase